MHNTMPFHSIMLEDNSSVVEYCGPSKYTLRHYTLHLDTMWIWCVV